MSLEQAITDHASALRELAAAIRATISGAHEITTATDKVISDAKKPAAAATKAEAVAQKDGAQGDDAKKPADTRTVVTTAKADAATGSRSEGPAPTYDDVKDKVLELSKAKGREPTVQLLQRHGVAKAPELKDTQYADFIKDVDAIMAGTYNPEAAELA